MEPILILGLWVGILSGLLPLIYGLIKDQPKLAIGGFFACAFSGVVLGALLAFPMSGLFFYLIKKAKSK